MFLSVLSIFCAFVGCILFGIVSIYFGVVLRKKYKSLEDEPEEELYFDATKLDYDEDVYFIGDNSTRTKKIGKNFVQRIALNSPSIGLFILGIGFLSIAIVSLIRVFI